MPVARRAKDTPAAWIEQSQVYGDLAKNEYIRERFAYWLGVIWEKGAVAAMDEYLG